MSTATRVYQFSRNGFHREPTRQEQIVAFLVRWATLAAAVWVAAQLVDGITLEGWRSTLAVALILGLLNAIVRPALFWLSLPLTVLTLGLFLLVLNAAMLGLAAWIAGKFDAIHFTVDGFGAAFLGALVITVVSWLIGLVVDPKRVARDLSR